MVFELTRQNLLGLMAVATLVVAAALALFDNQTRKRYEKRQEEILEILRKISGQNKTGT